MLVIPNYLRGTGSSSESAWTASMTDTSLRTGTIIAVHEPKKSGDVFSYDVLVNHSNGVRTTNITYYNVRMASMFGGVADFCKWIPRLENRKDDGLTLSNQVLLMCINGNSREAVIIGGIDHPAGTGDSSFGNSFYLDFEYNGVNVFIDEEGQFQITRRGKTTASGKVADGEEHPNATYQLTKDGEHLLGYLDFLDDSASDNAFFKITRKDKKIKAYSKDNTEFKTDNNFKITTTNGVKVNPDNAQQQSWVNGTDFRQNQQTLHQNLMTDLTNAATALSSATTSLGVAALSNAVPMYGGAMALPSFITMVSFLLQAISAVTKAVGDIGSFEAQSVKYLSQKHTHAD
jgi:hypothetical protein